jgi:hypothetical protein
MLFNTLLYTHTYVVIIPERIARNVLVFTRIITSLTAWRGALNERRKKACRRSKPKQSPLGNALGTDKRTTW